MICVTLKKPNTQNLNKLPNLLYFQLGNLPLEFLIFLYLTNLVKNMNFSFYFEDQVMNNAYNLCAIASLTNFL